MDKGNRTAFRRQPGYGAVFTAVKQVLSDGKPRAAAEIRDEAIKRSLLKPTVTASEIAIGLNGYIQRVTVHGATPVIVEDLVTREFRFNGPIDDWPPVTLPTRPRYCDGAAIDAIEERLDETAHGKNPAAFEQATCDAFAIMGFVATHIGGFSRPDGIIEAPLGPLSFRAVIECKSVPSGGVARLPQVEEPARFRDEIGAEFAVLVGPAFKDETSLHAELLTHKVSLWTIEDIVGALRIDVDTLECRELFVAGLVHDGLAALEWQRIHGAEKRVLYIRQILRRQGYATQRSLVGGVAPAEAPVLSLDAAMLLVEAELQKAAITHMATREEIRTAMDDLVRAEEAVTVPGRDGIVIRRGLSRA